MAYNGSGSYSPPSSSFPAVSGSLIEAGKYNNVVNDIATALSTAITKDGQTTVTANLPMSGQRHTGVGNAVSRTDYSATGQVQDSSFTYAGTAGGTANDITIALTPPVPAYVAGQTFTYKSGSSSNTGAMTVSINGLAAKAIQKNGIALTKGEHIANRFYRITYDGTAFQLEKVVSTLPMVSIDEGYGDGIVNATPAFQAVYDLPASGQTVRCHVPRGTYKLSTAPTPGAGNVIWELDSGVSFTGNTLAFVTPAKYQGTHKGPGYNTSVVGGAVERIVSKLVPEDSVFMVSSENYGGSTIFPEDSVLVHFKTTNSDASPRAWTQNTNIVKQSTATDNYSCGLEISAQNQTTETGVPNAPGCLMGCFVSYIDSGSGSNYGSAAYVVGGTGASATTGWNHGIWIDNITTGGNAITIKNSAGNKMDAALDTRGFGGTFFTGAVALGNQHKICADDSTGTSRNIAILDSGDYLQISEPTIPVVLNSNGLLLPNLPTAGTAGAIQGYIVVAIGGVNRKIPYYAM